VNPVIYPQLYIGGGGSTRRVGTPTSSGRPTTDTTDTPDPTVADPERLFGAKYAGVRFVADGRHAWLRITPDKIMSWDFRKLGG
jgi:hypothetical protein